MGLFNDRKKCTDRISFFDTSPSFELFQMLLSVLTRFASVHNLPLGKEVSNGYINDMGGCGWLEYKIPEGGFWKIDLTDIGGGDRGLADVTITLESNRSKEEIKEILRQMVEAIEEKTIEAGIRTLSKHGKAQV